MASKDSLLAGGIIMKVQNYNDTGKMLRGLERILGDMSTPEKGDDDETLSEIMYDLRAISRGCEDVHKFLQAITDERRRRSAEVPKIKKHPHLTNRRFRKAKTYSNWCYLDGLRYNKHSDGAFNTNWHFFQTGDTVQFKSPKTGKLVTTVIHTTVQTSKAGMETIEHREAYIKIGGRQVRVTNAPPMRLVEK